MITRDVLALIALIVLIVLLIFTIARRHTNQGSSRDVHFRAKVQCNKALDDATGRARTLRDLDNRGATLDADELFTKAMIYLRLRDECEDDRAIFARDQSCRPGGDSMRRARDYDERARITMRLAIQKRAAERVDTQPPENNPANRPVPLYHDQAIIQRAAEIGAIDLTLQRALLEDVVDHAHAHIPTAAETQKTDRVETHWAPDPESVHDSAVGGDVMRRLSYMRAHDLRAIDAQACAGHIASIMSARLSRDDPKCSKINTTLERAQANAHCSRYDIDELEALRLVIERACFARSEEARNNMHDALLNALAECSDGPNSTVCLVGRISRYVASLDIVDEMMPADAIKSTDAYRAEIFAKLGAIQAAAQDGAITRDDIARIIAEYDGRMPPHIIQKIKDECLAVL